MPNLHVESWLVAAGRDPAPGSPLNVPLVPALRYILGGEDGHGGDGPVRAYARADGTPTWEALEAVIGGLESGAAVAYSTGMAAVARRVLKGFGTIVSFDGHGGAAEADAVCRRVRLIRHATSLGAVESTIERRAAIPGQRHLPPSLLRLSVGIEHADDLWADLDAAMTAAIR